MRENNLTQKELADKIGISVQSLNAKINGKIDFKVLEVQKICVILKIKNPEDIFFSINLHEMQEKRARKN